MIDIESIVGMYSDDFIVAAYQMLLDRTPDTAGFYNFKRIVYQGASNGAIAYMIIISEEFNSRYEVLNFRKYKSDYKKYVIKQRLVRIPILGKLINVLFIPSQINLLINHLDNTEIHINNVIEKNIHSINLTKGQFQNNIINYLKEKNEIVEANINNCRLSIGEVEDRIKGYTNDSNQNIIENINRYTQAVVNEVEQKIGEYINESNQKLLNNINKCTQTVSEIEDKFILYINESSQNINKITNDNLQNGSNNSNYINRIEQSINNINEQILSGLRLATIISEKTDYIPNFIAQNNLKNKSVITSIPGGILAVQVGDFIMGIPSEEWGLAMFLSLNGHFEPGSEKLFCSLIKEGMTVVDVGANLGIYTLHALRQGCKVYSYEPTPSTYELLKQNIKVNGFAESQKVHLYNLAVGDREYETSFTICQAMCGHNHLSIDDNDNTINVKVVSLDHHLTENDKVDFIKIDVEGEEYKVLKGMRQIINNNPQIMILIEFAPSHLERAGIKPNDLLCLIREYGLTILKVDDNSNTTSEVSDEELLKETSINLLLLHDKTRGV